MTTTRSPHNAGQTVTVQQISPMPVKDMDWGPITVRENWGRLFISWKDQEIIAVMQHYPALIEALQHFVEPATPATEPPGYVEVAKGRADWLLDAVACATQNRQFLRGDPEYDEVAGEAILLNGEKAISVAISRVLAARPAPQPAAEHEYPDPLIAEDRYEDDQPALHDELATMISDLSHTGELSMLYRMEIADRITALRAIISTATPAPSDKIAEAARVSDVELAAVLWREEAVNAGAPNSVAVGRTIEAFTEQSPELQARWLKFARAALRALAGKGE